MDPALASIIGTAILGGCSIVVAIITGRSGDRRRIDEAVEREVAEKLAQLDAHNRTGGDHDEA